MKQNSFVFHWDICMKLKSEIKEVDLQNGVNIHDCILLMSHTHKPHISFLLQSKPYGAPFDTMISVTLTYRSYF